jgi:hypothetical protein
MPRFSACILTLWVFLFALPARAQELGDSSKDRVVSAILAQLDPYMLRLNDRFYSSFDIDPRASPPAQGGGFAPVVVSQGAPIVRSGLIEVAPSSWSFALSPDGAGGWSGVVLLRLASYRVLDRTTRRFSQDLLQLHLWQWNVAIDNLGMTRVSVKMDQTNFPADNGPRELVASIFNVPPAAVTVGQPDRAEIDAAFGQANRSAPVMPMQQGCRPCETLQPNGSCKQWRAC